MDIPRPVILSAVCMLCLATMDAKAQTATTQAATGVTDIAATLHGVVNPGSASVYSYCTFQYGTGTSYGQTVNADPYGIIGTTPIAVAANPPGLLPNTTYHYRVVMARSSGGSYLGDDMTFTTGPPATLPSFGSVRADSIGDTAATFGIFNANGGGSATTVSVEYGTDANYGLVFTFPDVIPANNTLYFREACATGLIPSTLYHWRLKLTNAQGSAYSTDQSFTTMTTPVVTTGAATNIASLAATFHGTVNPMQQVFQVRFEYGTDSSYGSQTSATPDYVHGSGSTPVSARCGFLQPGTTYHYRTCAFASGIGTVPGPDQVFTTQPDIAALSVTNVTDLGATVSGTVDAGSISNPYTFWFEYGTSTAYGSRTSGPASTQSDPLHPELKLVTAGLYNLLPGTLYHCRIKVQERYYDPIFSGSDFTFTTAAPATPPTVFSPPRVSAVVPTAATFNARISSGSSDATVTVEYGIDTTYGSQAGVSVIVPVSSGSDVSVPVTGLAPNTTYHYRFKATNNEGSGVGTDGTFTTTGLPDVSTSLASYVGSSWARTNGVYNPRMANYAATIEYGTSTAYGSSAAAVSSEFGIVIVGGSTPVSVYADLRGIAPSTTYHYRLKLADGYGNYYYGDDATFSTLAPGAAWREHFFNTTDETGDRADLANPAGDGVPNLLKYALGLDPTKQAASSRPYPQIAGDGETYLTFSFSRVSVATDLTCEVQVTGNLAGPWTTIATSSGGNPFTGPGLVRDISYADLDPGGGGVIISFSSYPPPPPSYPGADYFVTVRDTVPLSQASSRFMRLRVLR
jgi:trimeric autotransporter adhesin